MGHLNRKKEMFKGIIPKVGTKEYEYFKREMIKLEGVGDDYVKKNWEKINRSLEAQCLSSCNFLTEETLRHFLKEFNNRAWNYSLWSMPTMFNVMESFFKYNKPEIYFELIEEENYYLCFYDFIDFITSHSFTKDKSVIEESIQEGLIYNFEIKEDYNKITFRSTEGLVFIVRGISIIRFENEITISIITGRKITNKDILDKKTAYSEPFNEVKAEMINKANARLDKEEWKYEFIDEGEEFIKTLVVARIDIESLTIESRYIAEETNMFFEVVTDDIVVFAGSNEEKVKEEILSLYEKNVKRLETYVAIYDLLSYLIYLPFYFSLNEDKIESEYLDTDYKDIVKNPFLKKKYTNTIGYKASTKPVYFIDKVSSLIANRTHLKDDFLKVEKSGFWKELNQGEYGMDKKGRSIYGKTWVNKNLSWYEFSEKELIIEKEEVSFEGMNVGYIYILRNAQLGEDIFKIGLTRKEVEERAKELSRTSIPDKYNIVQKWLVKDCVLAEKTIHKILDKYRVDPRREFFCIKYEKIVDVVNEVITGINK